MDTKKLNRVFIITISVFFLSMIIGLAVEASRLNPARGDANGDLAVTETDTETIVRYVAGYNVGLSSLDADVNRDGDVTLKDAAVLCKLFNSSEEYRNIYLSYRERDDYDCREIEELFLMELAENGYPAPVLYDSSELTTDILTHRDGKFIVERCFGIVMNDSGDGKLLNPARLSADYIAYRSVFPRPAKGSLVLTFFLYDTSDNYVDSITERYDFILLSY